MKKINLLMILTIIFMALYNYWLLYDTGINYRATDRIKDSNNIWQGSLPYKRNIYIVDNPSDYIKSYQTVGYHNIDRDYDFLGLYDSDNGNIYIKKDLSEHIEKESIVVHEYGHALLQDIVLEERGMLIGSMLSRNNTNINPSESIRYYLLYPSFLRRVIEEYIQLDTYNHMNYNFDEYFASGFENYINGKKENNSDLLNQYFSSLENL